jgi:hypothetical protein
MFVFRRIGTFIFWLIYVIAYRPFRKDGRK